MSKRICVVLLVLCISSPAVFAQDTIKDGLTVWTSSWDDGSFDIGYEIIQWTYSAQDDSWEPEFQFLTMPEILGEDYVGDVHDMGMDMIILPGASRRSVILTVSKGSSHFPSEGTQFQHRQLNEAGEWEPVQEPLFTTPPDVSPLGVDIYMDGDEIHIA